MTALLLTAWLACQVFDAGTTYAGLQSGRFREANGALRSHPFALKLAVNVGMVGWHLQIRDQHPVLIPVAMAVSGCTAAALNLHTMRTP